MILLLALRLAPEQFAVAVMQKPHYSCRACAPPGMKSVDKDSWEEDQPVGEAHRRPSFELIHNPGLMRP
jgi:hypothetical protein